jgi:hypothetical protein
MKSRTRLLSAMALSLGTGLAVGTAAMAADLPQSGTIKIHSTGKGSTQAVEVGKKHFMGSYNYWFVTYNDAGSGPLHMGAALCTGSFDGINGSSDNGGWCAWGDAGGADKIFIVWTGKGTGDVDYQGTGTITGGTGKYAGIQGKMVWQCKTVEPSQGLNTCTQQFDYQLNAAAASR